MSRNIWMGAGLMALGLAGQGAFAATGAGQSNDALETVVVTAAGTQQKIDDASASISVISSEQLESEPYMSLTDALRDVAGVQMSNAKNVFTPSLRGLSSSYVLTMVDGERINSSSSLFRYNDFDYSWLPMEAIERVEVVRGSMSSLYGSDAIGGVVNVITKPVADHWMGSVTGAYTAQEDSGSGNSYKMDGFISGPIIKDKVGFKAWAGYDRRLEDKSSQAGSAYAGSAVGAIADKHNVFAHGSVDYTPDQDTKIEGSLGYTKSNHKDFIMDRGNFTVSAEHDFGFMKSTARIYGDRIHNYTGSGSSTAQPNTASDLAYETRETIPLADWDQIVTVGADFRQQTLHDPYLLTGLPGVNYGTDPNSGVHQWSLFGEDVISVVPGLSLTLGERLDHHQSFGSHHSPRAYLVWHATQNLTFRGGWSRAFKAPTLLQNSPNWSTSSCGGTGCYIIGNPDLKPETSTSYEAGAQFHMDGIRVGVTAFQIRLHDMIDYSHTSSLEDAADYSNFVEYLDADGNTCTYSGGECVSSVFEYQNIDNARSRGVETTFEVPVTDTVKLTGNYTYLDARDLTGKVPLTNQANHTVNLRVNWEVRPDLGLFASSRFLGKQYLGYGTSRESYVTFDVGGRYDVLKSSTLRFGIMNLTDRTPPAESNLEYKVDGRQYFVSLTQRL